MPKRCGKDARRDPCAGSCSFERTVDEGVGAQGREKAAGIVGDPTGGDAAIAVELRIGGDGVHFAAGHVLGFVERLHSAEKPVALQAVEAAGKLGVADRMVGGEGCKLATCLLYPSDAAEEEDSGDLGGGRVV